MNENVGLRVHQVNDFSSVADFVNEPVLDSVSTVIDRSSDSERETEGVTDSDPLGVPGGVMVGVTERLDVVEIERLGVADIEPDIDMEDEPVMVAKVSVAEGFEERETLMEDDGENDGVRVSVGLGVRVLVTLWLKVPVKLLESEAEDDIVVVVE